ncbi:hypothetical protein R9C00_07665 [Flammeovirgaceae bacterium SG7u.111]|nr:hypothetical protein [Flammeovirgaceae bacterium SG7u.132]WPO37323.1 hypothetical protein R9C00_07665 [Flammeovirgaceae bacterium SG7u.111]
MSKKSFTSDANDIFGEYAAPKAKEATATPVKEKPAKKALTVKKGEYEMYLLPMEKEQLAKTKKLAEENKVEVKDVVATALSAYLAE